MRPMRVVGPLAVAALAVLATAPALCAQRSKSLVGVYDLEPGLVHPAILPKLHERSRSMEGLELGLHPSVPMRIELRPGKRNGEYWIEGEPKLGITRLILPGLVNHKLDYGRKQKRPVRFEIWGRGGALWICNHHGAEGELEGHRITFVDLDHDGRYGAITDGYVLRRPKEKYWADAEGNVAFRGMSEPVEIDGARYWLQCDDGAFTMFVSAKEPDFAAQREEDYQRALQRLNAWRASLGHDPVTLSRELSRACEEHALYCATNGELTHDQDPAKPGASSSGAKAGKAGELAYGTTMEAGLQVLIGTFFHRIGMLSPGLQRVGMGLQQGVVVLDAHSERKNVAFEPWAWPIDGAADVPPAWQNGEWPSPIGVGEFTGEVARNWGYPVTLTFPSKAVTGVDAKLFAGDTELATFVSTPERPSQAEFDDNKNTILLMARSPMPANSEVRVEVRCTFAGKPFERIWRFRTRGQ